MIGKWARRFVGWLERVEVCCGTVLKWIGDFPDFFPNIRSVGVLATVAVFGALFIAVAVSILVAVIVMFGTWVFDILEV